MVCGENLSSVEQIEQIYTLLMYECYMNLCFRVKS